MPNQRAKGQKLLTLPASEEFIRAIDDNFEALGYDNRSQFIRDAIAEKLNIPKRLTRAPLRVRPRAVSYEMNDKLSSKNDVVADGYFSEKKKPVAYPSLRRGGKSAKRRHLVPAAPPKV